MAQATQRTPAWFKECREALGLRQDELAEKMHLNKNSIYRKESPRYAVAITERDVRDLLSFMVAAAKSKKAYPNRNEAELSRLLGAEQ